jgi:FAD/FMN-containing dehydrogenase
MKHIMQNIGGWGNCPVEQCYVTRPHTVESLKEVVARGDQANYIPRGLGRAYGDSALNRDAGVVVQTSLNRFVGFDVRQGVLECEAGVSLQEIITYFLPRGWFLPTTPGTKYVTVGGAIAADIHGKNHHADGSFGMFVLDLTLVTASGEIIACSPSNRPDVFWATIGGMGLTGIIATARIRLRRVETAYCDVTYRRTADLDETLDCFTGGDSSSTYSVAWIDSLARGPSLGRSVIMQANDAKVCELPLSLQAKALAIPARRQQSVPFSCPAFLLNSWSVKAFNALYYSGNRNNRRLVDYETFFYPLDRVQHWNRIYGRRGFVQYQALFPPATARDGLMALLGCITNSRMGSFLAVFKRTGPASQGMLSFPYPGYTLALDFPNTGEALRHLVRQLDAILLKHNGRLYLAKDALTSAENFSAMYPRLQEFRRVKERIDPHRRFVSSQSRRLGI